MASTPLSVTTVTGLTAARMEEIEDASVVDGNVVGNNLHLVTHGGTVIDAGNVRGPIGPSGSAFTICTSTTRPTGLTLADEGLAIYEKDTNLTRIWAGSRWRTQNRIICTSTTRPTGFDAADEGIEIYETDTGREYIWNGGTWVLDSRAYMLSETIRTVDSTLITTAEHEFSGYDELITVVADRKYYAKFGYRCDNSAVGDIQIMFSIWSGNVVTGTKYSHAEFTLNNTEWKGAELPLLLPAGNHTLRFSARSLTSGGTFLVSGSPNWPGFYQLLERR